MQTPQKQIVSRCREQSEAVDYIRTDSQAFGGGRQYCVAGTLSSLREKFYCLSSGKFHGV